MTVTLTVHRGTQAIGGSCIEIATGGGRRLILDAGRPLDAPRGATGLLPTTLDTTAPAHVLFSHPHMDHWGLIGELPSHWTIRTGAKSAELMRLTEELFGGRLNRQIDTWTSRSGSFGLGPFTVTPFLTDHSAVDAYMLLIEVEGKRIFYTGDFRAHGRKATLVEKMIAQPPPDIDVLLIEGTNLGSAKPVNSEETLENSFVELAKKTKRHIFVQWSAQNIDRTVTLFRAARRSGRVLAVDLYAADVLERVGSGTRIPVPGSDCPELKVVILPGGKGLYQRQGRSDFVTRMAESPFAVSRRWLLSKPAFIMARDSMLGDFAKGGLGFTSDDAYVFSAWSGYLDVTDERTGWARAEAAGARTERIHTSRHASPADIARFAGAINARTVVPVHGIVWDDPQNALPNMKRLGDGERWTVESLARQRGA